MTNYMRNFVRSMNTMFENNSCTNNGRVRIQYVHRDLAGWVIEVRVLDDKRLINPDAYTDFGLMMAIMRQVDLMYNAH